MYGDDNVEDYLKKLFEKENIQYELSYFRLFQSIVWYLNIHNEMVDFQCLYDYCMHLQTGFYYKGVNLHESYIFLDWASSENINHNEAQYFYDSFKINIDFDKRFQYFDMLFNVIFENKIAIESILKIPLKRARMCIINENKL